MKKNTLYTKLRFAAVVIVLILSGKINAQPNSTFCVMELFTSEGCSSCPTADNMLNSASTTEEASQSTNNIFMALHVKMWDNGGWTDPYGQNAFDGMFYDYDNSGSGITYLSGNSFGTPLTVRNGQVGMNYSTQTVNTTATAFVNVSYNAITGNVLTVDYSLSGDLTNAEVRFFLLERNLVSHVTAGENAGATLTHQNVARSMVVINPTVMQGSVNLQIPPNGVTQNMRVVAYVRKKTTSPWSRKIVGATKGFKLSQVGIAENASMDGKLLMYPNPAENTIGFESETENIERVSILDLLGNVIGDATVNSTIGMLDISKLSPGIYFTRFSINGFFIEKKFVKQ